MKRKILIIGIALTFLAILAAESGTLFADIFGSLNAPSTASSSSSSSSLFPILAKCEINEDLFPEREFGVWDGEEQTTWETIFNEQVNEVIAAHLAPPKVVCGFSGAFDTPSPALTKLAMKLPDWKDRAGAAASSSSAQALTATSAGSLSESDMGPVLLEYLRTYECSLKQFDLLRIEQARIDIGLAQSSSSTASAPSGGAAASSAPRKIASIVRWDAVWKRALDIHQVVIRELHLQSARTSLERTLTMLAGLDRLRPLQRNLECLQRASIDIRNELGLAAETSACLPRVWDARSNLRSLAPASQAQPPAQP